jgi:cyclic pyranopterin phosphate synthase
VAGLGVSRLRLTGGEPLLRHDLPSLVARLAAVPGIADMALTTNGLLLRQAAGELKRAGLGRVTVSLDTLVPERARAFARVDGHAGILDGIEAAREAGFLVKLNAVVIRGFNDDELDALLGHARRVGAELRFVEYMDVGGATEWRPEAVVSRAEILERLRRVHGAVEALGGRGAAPAERFRLPDGTMFGIIASTTEPFCRDCDRARLTADGHWLTCLYAREGLDLRAPLRAGADDAAIARLIREGWRARSDRGAEQRLELEERMPLYPLEALRADPRREMHTRGG